MKPPLLAAQNVTWFLPDSAQPLLQDINFSVETGQWVILLGTNGCGKSSLVKLLNGTHATSQGTLCFEGVPASATWLRRQSSHIATLSQDVHRSAFGSLTIAQNLQLAQLKNKPLFSFNKKNMSAQEATDWFVRLIPTLADKLHQRVDTLSGGERQLVGLALCLLCPPKLLLLDEHTSALDPIASAYVMKQTFELVHRYKITTVMVTHRLEDAMQYGDRLWVMHQGRIVQDMDATQKRALSKADLLTLAYENHLA